MSDTCPSKVPLAKIRSNTITRSFCNEVTAAVGFPFVGPYSFTFIILLNRLKLPPSFPSTAGVSLVAMAVTTVTNDARATIVTPTAAQYVFIMLKELATPLLVAADCILFGLLPHVLTPAPCVVTFSAANTRTSSYTCFPHPITWSAAAVPEVQVQ